MDVNIDIPNYDELEAAREALVRTLRDENTSILFGSPVDPTLPGYLDVITNPKDLGTILADCERSLDEGEPYRDAASILKDVQLVWSNCLRYNDRPEDAPIVDICKFSQKIFLREWRKAGLPGISGVASDRKTPRSATRSRVYSMDKGRYIACIMMSRALVFFPCSTMRTLSISVSYF